MKDPDAAALLETYPLELFDAVHRGNPGDAEFYARICHASTRVLELGCGSGRVLQHLFEHGIPVQGLDRDPDAVAAACAKGLRAVVADMASFSLGERFQHVIAPFSTLCCLASEADIERCFARVAAHLEPDGAFVFDVYAADGWHEQSEGEPAEPEFDDWSPVVAVQIGHTLWSVHERSRHLRAQQRLEVEYLHVPDDDPRRAVHTTTVHRYLLASELEGMLVKAELELRELWGDFEGSAYSDDSEIMVVRAARPRRG